MTQAPPKQYQRRSRQQWQQLIDAFEQTDLSSAQFCQQRQLSYQSFVKWRSVLKPKTKNNSASFVEMTPPARTPSCGSDWAVELSVGDHMVLRIR
jgi:hypothetical protein